MIFRAVFALVLVAGLMVGAAASADPPPLDHNDYANGANWLCRPGRVGDACDVDLAATDVRADGAMSVKPFEKGANPAIDCFYVYPTVSIDPGVLATMKVEPAEQVVIKQQFARFAAVCRPYAPLYRQFTVTAMIATMTGHPLSTTEVNLQTPYQDVLDAWNYYLAHDNHGRGVVLIGHSQGSEVLTKLIAREIDGKPEQQRLVLAILMGTNLTVPRGANVGGDFKHVPVCRTSSQPGCVIAFASFRDTAPPPATSFFGRPWKSGDDLAAACANPANLAGGEGPLKSYLASGSDMIALRSATPPGGWVEGKSVSTPFVTVPGLLTARCVTTPQFTYLAIHVNDTPGTRTKDIVGDLVIAGRVEPNWGLHLIDANLTIGNLIDIVGDEAAAWTRGR